MKLSIFAIFVLIINCSVYSQEPCLTKAWDAYNSKNYKSAIEFSEQCIDDFGKDAQTKQQEFDSRKISCPPIGAVSDAEKARIFTNGLLNDVSTACFIKGRAAEYLYKQDKKKNKEYKDIAINAYTLSRQYKCGRTFSNEGAGFFWSPNEACEKRLPLD